MDIFALEIDLNGPLNVNDQESIRAKIKVAGLLTYCCDHKSAAGHSARAGVKQERERPNVRTTQRDTPSDAA